MKKHLPIYLYGLIIILVGAFLLFSENSSFQNIKLTLGISLTAGAILAFAAAFARQRHQVQFAYHQMHALALLVYGIMLLLFCNSSEQLMEFTAFLFIFYAFSEIIFCNWLFNLAQKVVIKIIAIRALLGLDNWYWNGSSHELSRFYTQTLWCFVYFGWHKYYFYVPVMRANHSLENDKAQ